MTALKKNKDLPLNVPKGRFETELITRDALAKFLADIAKKRGFVRNQKRKYASNPKFSAIYTKDHLESILSETITKVVNAHEAFVCREKGLEIPEYCPNISEKLDLKTYGMIIGYFHTAFKNNVSKDYSLHTGNKRDGDLVSYSVSDESSEDGKENIVAFNQMQCDPITEHFDKKEYLRIIDEIFNFLVKYDNKVNEYKMQKYKGNLPKTKIAQYSQIFKLLLDPELKGKFNEIKDYVDMSQYLFNKKKDKLVKIIRENFPEESKFIYNYITEKYDVYGENVKPKKTKNFYDQSCDVVTAFQEKKINARITEVSYFIYLYRIENGLKKVLKQKSFKKNVTKKNIEIAKDELLTKGEKIKIDYKNIAQSKRENALKDLYA